MRVRAHEAHAVCIQMNAEDDREARRDHMTVSAARFALGSSQQKRTSTRNTQISHGHACHMPHAKCTLCTFPDGGKTRDGSYPKRLVLIVYFVLFQAHNSATIRTVLALRNVLFSHDNPVFSAGLRVVRSRQRRWEQGVQSRESSTEQYGA